MGNCDNILFLGGSEQSTTEWISKLLGKATIDTRETSDTKGMNGSHTVSYRRAGRELLTPDELAQMSNDQCIYMLRGVRPFLSRKIKPGTGRFARPHSTLRHSEQWVLWAATGGNGGTPASPREKR
jgi:type IV secretion system protein VirD4